LTFSKFKNPLISKFRKPLEIIEFFRSINSANKQAFRHFLYNFLQAYSWKDSERKNVDFLAFIQIDESTQRKDV